MSDNQKVYERLDVQKNLIIKEYIYLKNNLKLISFLTDVSIENTQL